VPETWMSIPSVFDPIKIDQVNVWLENVTCPAPPRDEGLRLRCPVCKCERDCSNIRLLNGAKWRGVKCNRRQCGVTRSAAKWVCSCNVLWFTCPQHGPIGHRAGSQQDKPVKRNIHMCTSHDREPEPGPCRKRHQGLGHDNRSLPSSGAGPSNFGPARVVPMPSLGREAGVGVNRKAKRKHNPGIPNATRIKRRMTETDRLEAIASINRMRVARASNDPG
jgi:hypothetical protein